MIKWFAATGKTDGLNLPELPVDWTQFKKILPELELYCLGRYCSISSCGIIPLVKAEAELMAKETDKERFQRTRRRGLQIEEYTVRGLFYQEWMNGLEPEDIGEFEEQE